MSRVSNEELSNMLASWEHMPPSTNRCADIAVDLQVAREALRRSLSQLVWEQKKYDGESISDDIDAVVTIVRDALGKP